MESNWIIDPNPDYDLAIIEDTEDGEGVCEIGPRTEQNIKNANLIAAAPKMFNALRAILFQVAQGKVLERDACIKEARAIIAKAKEDK